MGTEAGDRVTLAPYARPVTIRTVGARCQHVGMETEATKHETTFPTIVQVVLDTQDARGLAEFYRQLFGLEYREGDEPPVDGAAGDKDWLVLSNPHGGPQLAFQQTEGVRPSTWPDDDVPQMYHLDTVVNSVQELQIQRQRALDLGATEVFDRSDDPDEPLYVFADPAGHPFCVFVG